MRQRPPPLLPQRRRLALVAAAQDRDFPPAVAQGLRKFLHHGRLARAAHRQIAHHHHQAAERLVMQNPVPVKPPARLHDPAEQPRQRLQKRPVNRRPRVRAPPQNYIDRVEFEGVDFFLQPRLRHA
jgi:hypothetical protein